ncbi:hypothetical protein bcgnr5390_43840 [Bacillus luti]
MGISNVTIKLNIGILNFVIIRLKIQLDLVVWKVSLFSEVGYTLERAVKLGINDKGLNADGNVSMI